MDKYKTLFQALAGTHLPTVYRAWPEGQAPALPFVCYRERGVANFAADNTAYTSAVDFDVELYSREKDLASEALVEGVLSSFGVWGKTETYIDSEKCYCIVYTIQL